MAGDELLDALKADWRASPVDLDRVRRRAARGRRVRKLWSFVHLVAAMIAAVFGGWFAWRAWSANDALVALSAAGLLLAVPMIVAEQLWLRRQGAASDLAAVEDLLAERRRQAEIALLLLRGTRHGALILTACATGALLLAFAGLTPPHPAFRIALTWAAAAALALVWHRWRRSRLEAELGETERLIAIYSRSRD
ncbi:MAG: hypothetical protein ACK4K7_08530 [Allosphingosinicella sp.]|uniref:hypothetical protein n=1 Tax=Allosphingosinicella sp. TaxID=2823234 RepID=UPI0039413F9F